MPQANPVTKKTKDDNHLAAEERSHSPLNIRPSMLNIDNLPEELIPKQVGLSIVFTLYNAPWLPG